MEEDVRTIQDPNDPDYIVKSEGEIVVKKEENLPQFFEKKEEPAQPVVSVHMSEKVGEVMNNAMQQAAVAAITEDEVLREEMKDTAKKFARSKMNVVKNDADKEDKEAFFNNKEDACECFGYAEKTTEKWAVKYMFGWKQFLDFLWITIGLFTFSPIIFIAKKINNTIKKTWVCVFLGVLIYVLIVLTPFIINWLGRV